MFMFLKEKPDCGGYGDALKTVTWVETTHV